MKVTYQHKDSVTALLRHTTINRKDKNVCNNEYRLNVCLYCRPNFLAYNLYLLDAMLYLGRQLFLWPAYHKFLQGFLYLVIFVRF
jgi:hypothetical protein